LAHGHNRLHVTFEELFDGAILVEFAIFGELQLQFVDVAMFVAD